MLRLTQGFFAKGRVVTWKNTYGFIKSADTGALLFAHKENIVAPSRGGLPTSIRTGMPVEFDVGQRDGNDCCLNITKVGGEPLTRADEVKEIRLDRLQSMKPRDFDPSNATQYEKIMSRLYESIKLLKKELTYQKNSVASLERLLLAVCEKQGVEVVATGEEYKAVRSAVWKDRIAAREERMEQIRKNRDHDAETHMDDEAEHFDDVEKNSEEDEVSAQNRKGKGNRRMLKKKVSKE